MRTTLIIIITILVVLGGLFALHHYLRRTPSRGPTGGAPVGGVAPTPIPGASPTLHTVSPSATDPKITGPVPGYGSYQHLAYAPVGTPVGKLLVFFAGTGGPPSGYSKIQEAAAQAGFHAIGLAYPNDASVNGVCERKASETDCQKNIRIETITGEDVSPDVQVDPENSIDNRLIKLLQYLNTNYPSEGWGQYLSNGQPVWSKIVVAGHSQGGGYSAMLGTLYDVNRVLMFSATEDASWTTEPHATPASAYYGFADTNEDSYRQFTGSWQNLGIPGSLTSVDGASPPYGGSHRLTTSDEPSDGLFRADNPYHAVVVTDPHTPSAADGSPLFLPVWLYMLGAAPAAAAGS